MEVCVNKNREMFARMMFSGEQDWEIELFANGGSAQVTLGSVAETFSAIS